MLPLGSTEQHALPLAGRRRDPRRAGLGRGGGAARRAGPAVAPVRPDAVLRRVPGQPDACGSRPTGAVLRDLLDSLHGAGLPALRARQRPRRQRPGPRPPRGWPAAASRTRRCSGTAGGTRRAPGPPSSRSTPSQPRLLAGELPLDAARRRRPAGRAEADGRHRRGCASRSGRRARAARRRLARRGLRAARRDVLGSGRPASRRSATLLETGWREPDLAGRVAVVTGTAHGIGAAIAGALEEHGATVHGVDKDTCDVTDSAQVDAFFAEDRRRRHPGQQRGRRRRAGRPAARGHHRRRLARRRRGEPDEHLRVHARGRPGNEAARLGRIVNISSGAGRSVSLTGIQAYASAKAGQIGFTRQTAHELGRFGITVNCIAPGFVLSNPTTDRAVGELRRGGPGRSSSSNRDAAAWARPRTSPTACCSSSPRPRPGSPGR